MTVAGIFRDHILENFVVNSCSFVPPQDADVSNIKVQVCVYAFDLLYLNGEPLVRRPFDERRSLLREHLKEIDGEFVFATSAISSNTEDIEEFLEESIKGTVRECHHTLYSRLLL